jgi:chemotaxis methyl-accepting protein methylase
MRALPIARSYAGYLDRTVRRYADRKQYFATFFMRNRPELELLNRLVARKSYGSHLDLTVLACSKGPEVYSIAWAIRCKRPDLQLKISAVDISEEILDFAGRGVYSMERPGMSADQFRGTHAGEDLQSNTDKDQNAWIFERLSREELDAMFEVKGNQAHIRSCLKEDIRWICGDAGSPHLKETLGPQDIVVANRFLCHMQPEDARSCLRNIAKMVKSGGHLFVSGVDLEVRSAVAVEMGWRPVPDMISEIHDGDPSIRRGWPLEYWGLEPLDRSRADWQLRYASVFEIGGQPPAMPMELATAEHSGR